MVSAQSTNQAPEELASRYIARCVIDADKIREMLGLDKPAPKYTGSTGGGAAVARVIRTNVPTPRRFANV